MRVLLIALLIFSFSLSSSVSLAVDSAPAANSNGVKKAKLALGIFLLAVTGGLNDKKKVEAVFKAAAANPSPSTTQPPPPANNYDDVVLDEAANPMVGPPAEPALPIPPPPEDPTPPQEVVKKEECTTYINNKVVCCPRGRPFECHELTNENPTAPPSAFGFKPSQAKPSPSNETQRKPARSGPRGGTY